MAALKVARRSAIPPFIVMEVMRAANARQASGGDVLHLEVGQPSTAAPRAVIAAAQSALASDVIGYTEALGIPVLRQRIAQHYRDVYGLAVDSARVVVTTGSSGAFLLSFLVAFDAGDRVALADPGYPAYRNILRAIGVEPVGLPAGTATRFQPSPELLDQVTGPLHGLIVASPANPTGTMLDRAELMRLAEYCSRRGIRLVSDEIYHGIAYGKTATSALSVTNDAVIINSFSKYFSMTGWRLGWMVLPADLMRPVECLAQNLFISPPTLSQYAGVAAFDCRDECDANVARYARNRAVLLDELPKAGLSDLAPADGAFYIYANVGRFTNDSEAFCKRMLAETGVAATPGIDFDPNRGHTSMRFSFAGATADMIEAARRIRVWLR
ncbi:MAG: aminotransferase class I/II-fold pyridoxal phosphate-dependent enzyme [Alphaproteobacteria bacterium]|nr:aminotransferase class I/II-fold pyridoxal phosphate-dependent enzyme [Alphaproteobacteria bacterium]